MPTIDNTPIERNDVSLTFVEQEIKRGDKKGTKYLGVTLQESDLPTVTKWLGEKAALAILSRTINQRAQGLADEATGDDKTINMSTLVELLKTFSARGESKSELEEQVSLLTDEMVNMDKTNPDNVTRIFAIIDEIKSLQVAIESKTRERKAAAAPAAAPAV